MKIALVLNDDFSMWRFRKGLIVELVKRGHSVYAITPDGPYVPNIRSLGAAHLPIPMGRFITPLKDVILFARIFRMCKKEKFDIVHTMTIKPNIYGTMAAKWAGVSRVFGLVSGMGFVFSEVGSLKLRFLRFLIKKMYKFSFRFSDKIWFQNTEDRYYFEQEKLLAPHKAVVIISGGVNVEEYFIGNLNREAMQNIRTTLEMKESDLLVSMVTARIVKSKGVLEFMDAAESLAGKYRHVKFLLAGPIEKDSPDTIAEKDIQSRESESLKLFLSFRSDAREIVGLSDIIVLPSYYKEGVPRVLLEALSLGKPVVTTDSTGCKEVVREGKNGFMVPIKDADALRRALEVLILDEQKRKEFGRQSRVLVEENFSEPAVVKRVMEEFYDESRLPDELQKRA